MSSEFDIKVERADSENDSDVIVCSETKLIKKDIEQMIKIEKNEQKHTVSLMRGEFNE